METVRVYLGLGTNLGEREANLNDAVERLGELGDVVERSSIIETDPWGYSEQGRFLNMVVALETRLSPLELLTRLKGIEQEMGRVPSVRYGPRLIDLDILLYGDDRIDVPGLTIPHPRMAERDFVTRPLAELGVRGPDFRIPPRA